MTKPSSRGDSAPCADSTRRRLLTSLWSFTVCLLASQLTAQTVQTQWQGQGALVVRATSAEAAGALVEYPDGERFAIDLPEGATLNSLSEFAGDSGEARFMLAGSREGAPDGSDGSQLFLLSGRRSNQGTAIDVRTVLPPSMLGETPGLRITPVLMHRNGELHGLVWLQGDSTRTLEVWAADWREGGFDQPQRVVASGPGSQLALSAAVLADDSWLLAWSRFDGQDDEIVTLQRRDGQWQELVAISNNGVPDITPSVIATDDGALVAWSRYQQNGYRLRLRSLVDQEWANPRSMTGEKALYPRFVDGNDRGARLMYRRSNPKSWVVADLDSAGTIRKQASVRTDDVSVPAVLEEGNDFVLRFSSRNGMVEARTTPETPAGIREQ